MEVGSGLAFQPFLYIDGNLSICRFSVCSVDDMMMLKFHTMYRHSALRQEEIGEEQPGSLGLQPHERHVAWPRTKDYEDRPPRSRDTAAYQGLMLSWYHYAIVCLDMFR